jgi:hypothetical protein
VLLLLFELQLVLLVQIELQVLVLLVHALRSGRVVQCGAGVPGYLEVLSPLLVSSLPGRRWVTGPRWLRFPSDRCSANDCQHIFDLGMVSASLPLSVLLFLCVCGIRTV